MALHHDLLEQASHLALREPKKPKQASLRRAVSAAYYALFHLLVAQGALLLSPRQPSGLNILIIRAFNHGQMREVCSGFVAISSTPRSQRVPAATRELLSLPLEPDLVQVLQAFVDLQEARHQADYDVAKDWNRLNVINHVQTAQLAFAAWANVRKTPNAAVVMAAFLLQKHWGR